MSMIRALHVWHSYRQNNQDEQARPALKDISLEVSPGDYVAILGHNGSGKSTLARHINALLRPTEGTIWIDGLDTAKDEDLLQIRKTAGMVFQNPDNQIIAGVVEEDVAFGPENIGVPTEEIWERVARSLESAGIARCRYHSPNRLSGGQKQRVAIAGIMAMQPSVMILDEATAMLDPQGRMLVLETVRQLNTQAGVTVIWITHDMQEAVCADRVIVMDHGKVAMDGSPAQVFARAEEVRRLGLTLPPAAEIAGRLRREGFALPEDILTVGQLKDALCSCMKPHGSMPALAGESQDPAEKKADAPILALKDVSFIYHPGTSYETQALKHIDLEFMPGQFIGLIGHTGCGKSTLVQMLNGLLTPSSGQVCFRGEDIHARGYSQRDLCAHVGLVFQNPEYQLFEETVLKDICFGPLNLGKSREEAEAAAREAMALVGLEERICEKSPFELSGGQMRRCAIAGILAMKPEVLVLDEPAAGLDPHGRQELLEMADRLRRDQGVTIIWSSHAMEDVAAFADRLIVMNEGTIARDGKPKDVFTVPAELEAIGLAAPQTVYLTQGLRQKGIDLGRDALTPEDACSLLLRYHQMNGGGTDAV